ncbi:MAG: hypothetical protein QOF43_2416 [Gaiellaceae bacterium]|nr:hypothetical protein [Gaiellaceae bacterium]
MDFFVSAAPDEAFGVAVVEAMTAGIPVVALSVGGPSEIVEDDRSGILTPLNALADGIVRVACDPALRARLAAGAIDRAATTFTAARMADEWGTQLERLGRRPGGK